MVKTRTKLSWPSRNPGKHRLPICRFLFRLPSSFDLAVCVPPLSTVFYQARAQRWIRRQDATRQRTFGYAMPLLGLRRYFSRPLQVVRLHRRPKPIQNFSFRLFSSTEYFPIERAIIDGFLQMVHLDLGRVLQVRNRERIGEADLNSMRVKPFPVSQQERLGKWR